MPSSTGLLNFVIRPRPNQTRLHCTMVRHTFNLSHCDNGASGGASEDASNLELSDTYTLYLEHLGGFLPLLKGKKVSKIRPDFVIFDPTLNGEELTGIHGVQNLSL